MMQYFGSVSVVLRPISSLVLALFEQNCLHHPSRFAACAQNKKVFFRVKDYESVEKILLGHLARGILCAVEALAVI